MIRLEQELTSLVAPGKWNIKGGKRAFLFMVLCSWYRFIIVVRVYELDS